LDNKKKTACIQSHSRAQTKG